MELKILEGFRSTFFKLPGVNLNDTSFSVEPKSYIISHFSFLFFMLVFFLIFKSPLFVVSVADYLPPSVVIDFFLALFHYLSFVITYCQIYIVLPCPFYGFKCSLY